ncbi:M16 family metallopeptidase [Francisella adeliensis]|uniref:Insulinase family protein n=1 Tax=Francisella adeliensis TaxID=2007306 RepID=A0A2Z4XYR6_9GAMM|nr:pitrilysin family protein [Francisella adeliensis]AXA33583.1 peptidase M16 [Francisella adeliensis]MBK2085174.1 insulinase family protein [Francisella adeliensis]MBK2097349.1 insulinase family protein [Francisella adeliensis]QIW11815.1 insulinase family protein [Francisella adeliensis]QIW13691.1 insulinase family protein [Francisella adeliensis]
MIQKSTINNTNIYFEQANSIPMLDIALNFRAGSAFDGKLNGLADLAVGLFGTQTKTSSEEELINKITDIGASIHAETSKEYFSIKIRSLSDENILVKLFEILEEIFTQPDFNEDILAREKLQTTTHIKYLYNQPNYLASLEFSKNLFRDNPYSHPTIGHIETIEKITVKDIKDFYDTNICANNTNICIIGDIDNTKAQNLASTLISFLPVGNKNIENSTQHSVSKTTITKIFASKQTSILMGHQLFLDIDDSLYFPLKLGNEILGGGGLNSLLFNKVREELGLVYNVGSSINLNPDYGSFVISAQTSNPELALKTINDVYTDFISSNIDEETLCNSKKHIEGTHLLGSVRNSSRLSMMSSIANKDLALDFFDTYVDNINKVSSTDIKNAFIEVQKNQMLTVMVGDV